MSSSCVSASVVSTMAKTQTCSSDQARTSGVLNAITEGPQLRSPLQTSLIQHKVRTKTTLGIISARLDQSGCFVTRVDHGTDDTVCSSIEHTRDETHVKRRYSHNWRIFGKQNHGNHVDNIAHIHHSMLHVNDDVVEVFICSHNLGGIWMSN
jgi:hypothetical protein